MLLSPSSLMKGISEKWERVEFHSDIPSKDWVSQKRRFAEEDGRNEFGVPKFFGPVTGRFSRPLMLPLEMLSSVDGERGEKLSPRPESLDWISSHMERTGAFPHGAPFVVVDPFGVPWINEGNHRLMVSLSKGISHVPVEVRYFSGGQELAGDFSPESLMSLDESFLLSVGMSKVVHPSLEA